MNNIARSVSYTICLGTALLFITSTYAQNIFPPRSGKNDAAATDLTSNSRLEAQIPDDDPLRPEGETQPRGGAWGEGGIFLSMIPVEGKFKITGGTFETYIGNIRKRAKFTDWDRVYRDGTKDIIAWAAMLTEGEILIPKVLISHTPRTLAIKNHYALEDFGPHFFLIRLDPAKRHRLGLFRGDNGQWNITSDYIGGLVDVNQRTIERKQDGWYEGSQKLPATQ